jgi:hypothetical protein
LAQDAFTRLEASLRVDPPTTQSLAALEAALAQLRRVLREGAAATAIYDELQRSTETIRRLVATDRRHASAQERYHDRQAASEAREAEILAQLGVGAETRRRRPRPRPHPAPQARPPAGEPPPGPPPVR